MHESDSVLQSAVQPARRPDKKKKGQAYYKTLLSCVAARLSESVTDNAEGLPIDKCYRTTKEKLPAATTRNAAVVAPRYTYLKGIAIAALCMSRPCPATGRITSLDNSDVVTVSDDVFSENAAGSLGNRQTISIAKSDSMSRVKFNMAGEDVLVFTQDRGSPLSISNPNCTNAEVAVEVMPGADSTTGYVAEVWPDECMHWILMSPAPPAGKERDEYGDQPIPYRSSGRREDGGRHLATSCNQAPCSGSTASYLEINLSSGANPGMKVRMSTLNYGIVVYTSAPGMDADVVGRELVYEATSDVACTHAIKLGFIRGTAAQTPFVEVWRYGGPVGAWRHKNMDILAECRKESGDYVSLPYSVAKGPEIIEYDWYPYWNSVLRSGSVEGQQTVAKLLDYNCDGTAPAFPTLGCQYTTKPTYVSDFYDQTVCGEQGSEYVFSNGDVFSARRLVSRRAQALVSSFIIGCASAVAEGVLVSMISEGLAAAQLPGQEDATAYVSNTGAYVLLSLEAVTALTEMTPGGLFASWACSTAFTVATQYWGTSFSPGQGAITPGANAMVSGAICS